MSESPPGNEKPGLQAGLLTDSAFTISETQPDCNSKIKSIDSMPDGVGYFFDEAGKRHYEECELHPTLEPEQTVSPELLELSRRTAVLYDWALADELTPKVCAVRYVLGQDRRDAKTIAASLGVTPELVRLRIREAKKLLGELRREARP